MSELGSNTILELDNQSPLTRGQRYYRKNRDRRKAMAVAWRKKNPDRFKEYQLASRKKYLARPGVREKLRIAAKAWLARNPGKQSQYAAKAARKAYHADMAFRIEKNLRNRIGSAIRNEAGARKSENSRTLLGCSIQEFKSHIESLFSEGMGWDNRNLWHIDHILPCACFDLADPAQQKACFHYTNLQPLWARDNLKKSDKVVKNIN